MYRPNVAALIFNELRQVLGCRRVDGGWGIVQGGVDAGEDSLHAAYREIHEEIGLLKSDLTFVAILDPPVRYDLPPGAGAWMRSKGFVGQEQTVTVFFAQAPTIQKMNLDGLDGEPAEFSEAHWMPLDELARALPLFKAPVVDLITQRVPALMEQFLSTSSTRQS